MLQLAQCFVLWPALIANYVPDFQLHICIHMCMCVCVCVCLCDRALWAVSGSAVSSVPTVGARAGRGCGCSQRVVLRARLSNFAI